MSEHDGNQASRANGSTPKRTLRGGLCLVTGSAGFLGQNLVRALATRGCRVRGLDLAEAPAALADVADLEWVRGDIRDHAVVSKACAGVDTVFHTAALIELFTWCPKDFAAFVRSVNLGGTEALLEAAVRQGVNRLVFTSSTNAVYGQQTSGGDETSPYSVSPDLYSSTKVACEKLVLNANGRGGLRTAAIRPGGIYGPGERGTLIGPLVESLGAGYPLVTLGRKDKRIDYSYIDSLVDGHLRAAERLVEGSAVCGEAYFITDDEPICTSAFSRKLVDYMGLDVKHVHVPGSVARAITGVLERVFQVFGKPKPPLTVTHVRLTELDVYFSIDKARRDLGYAPLVTLEEGLRRTAKEARAYYDSLGESRAVRNA